MPRNCKRRRLLTLHIWSYGGSCHEVVNGEDYWCSIYGRTVVHATRNKRHKFKSADSLVNAYILCTDILYAWLTILIKNRFYVNNIFCNAQARPPMLNICLVLQATWMLLVFQTVFFSSCNIMDWVYRGWAGGRRVGGGGGGWEAEGGLKQPLRLKEQWCAFSLWHKLIQSTKEAKTGMRSSLVPQQSY